MAAPSPRELARQISERLWSGLSQGTWTVQVTRLDKDGRRRCAAWDAEWYEAAAYFTDLGASLTELEQALKTWPGVLRTTRVTGYPARIRDEDWPGWDRRRDRNSLRPQVLALITVRGQEQETRS